MMKPLWICCSVAYKASMLEWIRNYLKGVHWLVEYTDTYSHDITVLPQKHYTKGCAQRKARALERKSKGQPKDTAQAIGPFKR